VEDPIDEVSVRELADRVTVARQAAVSSYSTSNISLITATTTLEYGGQASDQQSNIYGLVTLKTLPIILSSDDEILSSSHIPIDLVCVVDQSRSMRGEKINLLKQTLTYITEQLNEFDRLAIISFNTSAFDRSHGLKRMSQQK
jgi:Mg-chelatase subunit ChlD